MTDTPILPMKLTDVAVTSAEHYITDELWVMEQKMDGARAMVIIRRSAENKLTFSWLASGGGPLKFAAAVQHFPTIEEELTRQLQGRGFLNLIFDGELMTEDGEYRIFDCVLAQTETALGVHAGMPFYWRRRQLVGILTETGPVRIVDQISGTEEKREFWKRIQESQVEGAVAKKLDAPYVYGVRTTDQVKLKLVKSADVIVTGISNWTGTTGSAELGVMVGEDPKPWLNPKGRRYTIMEAEALPSKRQDELIHDPRELMPIGKASLIGKDRSIQIGSVVEVNYLYWTGDAMVQPRIVRRRLPEEKQARDCTLNQFPEYSRAVV